MILAGTLHAGTWTYRILGALALLTCVIVFAWYWSSRTSTADPEASFQRGLAAVESRDVIALHREIQILKRFPLYLHQMQLLRGTVLLDGGDYEAALVELAACSHDPATQAISLRLAGEILCRTERQGDAIAVLERSVKLKPDSAEAYRWLAIAYYDTGGSTQAVAALKKLAKLVPNDYRPHRMLGMIQKDRSRFAEAVQEYRACLRLKPADQVVRAAILHELSDCLTQLNEYDDALRYLDEAPETADNLALRAHSYFGKGNRSAARNAAERALELAPDHIEARGWLGTLDLEAGNFKSAATQFERVVAKYPTEYAPRFKLSQAYQRLGKKSEAEKDLGLAKKYQALGQKFTELHDQANQNPTDPVIRFELGETARELDRIELARMWYRAALALEPGHAKAIQALKQLPPEPTDQNLLRGINSMHK